jgi:hypothetical protein
MFYIILISLPTIFPINFILASLNSPMIFAEECKIIKLSFTESLRSPIISALVGPNTCIMGVVWLYVVGFR